MLNEYPAVPLSWALRVANLTPSKMAYGIHNGFIKADVDTLSVPADTGRSSALAGKELAEARDVLFRLLSVNLHKHDFEDCPSVDIEGGRLHSLVAGAAETKIKPELDPEYFAGKVRGFVTLTEHVLLIVQQGIRAPSSSHAR